MTMRDLFKDENIDEITSDVTTDQPLITDGDDYGGDQSDEENQNTQYNDGTEIAQGIGDTAVVPHDFRYIDRLIKVKGMPNPKRNSVEESNFLTSNEFSEQFVINFLSEHDQKGIWRSLADVMDLAEGGGNSKVALNDAKLLAIKILMKRSSTENALNLNERGAHIEQRSRSVVTQRGDALRSSGQSGWLARLFGR